MRRCPVTKDEASHTVQVTINPDELPKLPHRMGWQVKKGLGDISFEDDKGPSGVRFLRIM
jgi:hypothetical protein